MSHESLQHHGPQSRLLALAVIFSLISLMTLVGGGAPAAEAAAPVDKCRFPCFEGFEDGYFDHAVMIDKFEGTLRLENLWHVSSKCLEAPSPPNYFGFNQDDTCEYPEGSKRKYDPDNLFHLNQNIKP